MVFKKAFWIFGTTVLIFVLFLPGYLKVQDLRDRNRELLNRITVLNKENVLLQQEFFRLQTDSEYLEKFAREKTGVVRKGEIPVKVVPAQ
ncbi:MAG: septum formation initiator family protein [Candidatus Omnitrophica bacterium]|nr:septum formation initiator family protein [Candidatus Omnitrophota bacterium]MDD5236157.1 septum formation initiator family protein [Candidatus Omnitrophota bacterium]MDD5611361.1 septum formation initiator family protein [Candidatus Omnitrophota bacterium]